MASKKTSKEAPKAKSPAKNGAIAVGSKVQIDYIGAFDDGKVFDSSIKSGKPIQFTVGSGQVIKGFDEAVLGLKRGDEKTVKLKAAEAYGEHRKELVKTILRGNLPTGRDPTPGMQIVIGLSNGREVPAQITAVKGDMVTIDLNHPLAGKTLNFKIKVVDFS